MEKERIIIIIMFFGLSVTTCDLSDDDDAMVHMVFNHGLLLKWSNHQRRRNPKSPQDEGRYIDLQHAIRRDDLGHLCLTDPDGWTLLGFCGSMVKMSPFNTEGHPQKENEPHQVIMKKY
jgi:hypothetical protein